MIEDQINQAKQWIEYADAALITAGAGMGVDMVPFISIEMVVFNNLCQYRIIHKIVS